MRDRRKTPLRRSGPLKRRTGLAHGYRLKRRTPKSELKAADRRAAKASYLDRYGYRQGAYFGADCQSCRLFTPKAVAEFSHKFPAGRGGDIGGRVQASNGIYSCACCHDLAEADAQIRKELIASDASCAQGDFVEWSEESRKKVITAHEKSGWLRWRGRR